MKACIACKYFSITDGWLGTVITCGFDPAMSCAKKHFTDSEVGANLPKVTLLAAEKCNDFEVSDLAKSKGWTE